MTDKFDDLMYQAGLTAQGCWDQMDDYDRTAILKFGELIVRECLEWCDAHATIDGSAQQVRNSIKQHFRVEE